MIRFAAAVLACAFLACAPAARDARYRGIEIRLVAEPGPGSSARDESDVAVLESDVLFSGKDFSAIDISRGGDDGRTPSLALHFTKEASERFQDLTTRRSGRRLAVVVGRKIVFAPKILHPITTGLFEITGPSEDDIRAMYRRIAGP